MTNSEILDIALRQSALELNCRVGDLLSKENKVVISAENPGARSYLRLPHKALPFACNLVYYGGGVVASVRPELVGPVSEFLNKREPYRCFETPGVHELDGILAPFGLKTCFMAEYFLPDMEKLRPLCCKYEMRILSPADFAGLYVPEWSNALCEKRAEYDVIAAGAYDGGKLIALAGASADCEDMWQIGIDVLPSYRRQGIASSLTSRLALEILDRGKVPFYCAAWSNLASVKNAIRSGFRPAWVELTARDDEFVDMMNIGE